MIRSYRELRRFETFEDRFNYLALTGIVGRSTFGFDRWINQKFYTSREWKQLRSHIISRDNGCDLGVNGYEIHHKLLVHHMNPVESYHLTSRDEALLDPNFLITTTHRTHNAIHYGDEKLLARPFVERKYGDTKLW